jgi:hypothetical protein
MKTRKCLETNQARTPSSYDNTVPLEDGCGCPATVINNAHQKWFRS